MKKNRDVLYKKINNIVTHLEDLVIQALQLKCTNPLRAEIAITIATKLRVLLNDEGRNVSLSTILGFKHEYVFPANNVGSFANIPGNLVFTSILTSICVENDKVYYCANEFSIVEDLLYKFDAWWNEIIIDSKYEMFSQISRRDVILTLADKEGGAHVDEVYDAAHYQTVRNERISCVDSQGNEILFSNDVYSEAALYIAQEFLNAYKIFLNIKPHTFEKKETEYKIFQLKYCRETNGSNKRFTQERYRFIKYKYGDPNTGIIFAFDSYQLATYWLLDLYEISPMQGYQSSAVIDLSSNSHRIVYARTPNCECRAILWKFQDKYKIINTEKDLYNGEWFRCLDDIAKQLYPENPNAFDKYWGKQIMD